MKYLTIDVLAYSDMPANSTASRELSIVSSVSGKVLIFDKHKVSRTSKQLTIQAIGRAEIGAIRDFITARMGRLVPFFIASYRPDFELYSAAEEGSVSVVFSGNRLSRFSPSRFNASRHFAIVNTSTNAIEGFFSAESVVATGPNDTVTLTSGLSQMLPEKTAVCILQYVRLSDDTCKIVYTSAEVADITITITDIPAETP